MKLHEFIIKESSRLNEFKQDWDYKKAIGTEGYDIDDLSYSDWADCFNVFCQEKEVTRKA